MKLDYLNEKKELVSTALLVISVLSAILILVKVTGFFVASANAETAVNDAIRHSKPDAKNVTAQLDNSKKVADALKKSNLFSPPPPKQNPIKMVMGIFGDEALINGKWYKAGDKVADARILAVNPTSVETEWNGKKKTFSPIDSSSASGPSGSSRPGRSTVSVRSSSSSGGGRPQMVVTKSDAGIKSPKANNPEATKIKKKYEGMSEAHKDTFKRVMKDRAEQYKQMSDSERKNFKAHIIERISQSG